MLLYLDAIINLKYAFIYCRYVNVYTSHIEIIVINLKTKIRSYQSFLTTQII